MGGGGREVKEGGGEGKKTGVTQRTPWHTANFLHQSYMGRSSLKPLLVLHKQVQVHW